MLLFQLILYILITGYVVEGAEYIECTDPNDEDGYCVPIRECTDIFNKFKVKPVPQATLEFMRKAQCTKVNNIPWVCCEGYEQEPPTNKAKPATAKKPVQPKTTTPSPEPVIDRSKLPKTCGVTKERPSTEESNEVTLIDEFPWNVILKYSKPKNEKPKIQCGGTLIHEQHVLTAAHCVRFEIEKVKLTSVILGEWNTETYVDCDDVNDEGICSGPALEILIQDQIVHNNYDGNQHDLALLKLSSKVKFNEFVYPICLPLTETTNYNAHALKVAGWGLLPTKSYSTTKVSGIVSGYSNEKCQSVYEDEEVKVDDLKLCAGSEWEKPCKGDSGGALIKNDIGVGFTIVGIANNDVCLEDFPRVYTRVYSYITWILTNMN